METGQQQKCDWVDTHGELKLVWDLDLLIINEAVNQHLVYEVPLSLE